MQIPLRCFHWECSWPFVLVSVDCFVEITIILFWDLVLFLISIFRFSDVLTQKINQKWFVVLFSYQLARYVKVTSDKHSYVMSGRHIQLLGCYYSGIVLSCPNHVKFNFVPKPHCILIINYALFGCKCLVTLCLLNIWYFSWLGHCDNSWRAGGVISK